MLALHVVGAAAFLSALAAGHLRGAEVKHGLQYVKGKHVMEVAWVQDFSLSYNSSLEAIRAGIPNVFDKVRDLFPNSRFALTGFVDKPEEPYGFAESLDYCFQLKYPLTNNVTHIREALNNSMIHSGGDWLESQMHALVGTIMNPEMRWSATSGTTDGRAINKFVLLSTDAGYHVAGDSEHKPNDLDGYEKCTQEDYPAVADVARLLELHDVTPIFLVSQQVSPVYRQLVKQFGSRGAVSVLPLDSGAEQIAKIVAEAIEGVLSHGDEAVYASSVCGDDPNCCAGRHCCPDDECDRAANAVIIKLKHMPKKMQLSLEY